MFKPRPHKDRVLLELIVDDKVSDGGLHIPDNAKKKYIRRGRVLAVSIDCKEPLKAGDEVFAVWNCGVLVELAGELPYGATNECRLFKSEDVWAVNLNAVSFDGDRFKEWECRADASYRAWQQRTGRV